ncbi:MAG: PD40 domain-containing protein [Gemmatirosa sp.]|nr:PD40 domain-containing protein [Gemmatirosa sp.]
MNERQLGRAAASLLLLSLATTACHDPAAPVGVDPRTGVVRPVLFAGGDGGTAAIYAVRPDGTDLRQLATGDGVVSYPAWSPDGTRIAFVSRRVTQSRIWLMDADGGHAAPLDDRFPACPTEFRTITWAPAGDRLAAECYTDTWIFDLRAGSSYGLLELLHPNGLPVQWVWHPAWSPDGSRISFDSPFDEASFVAGPRGEQVAQLATPAQQSSWSPDGRRIAFVGGSRPQAGVPIFVADANGASRRQVTSPGSLDTEVSPRWSPDGEWLAFQRIVLSCTGTPRQCQGPAQAVFVIRVDGSGLRQLTPFTLGASPPSW